MAQEHTASLEVTLDWLATKLPLAAHVDGQHGRWEWHPVEMTGCEISLRETRHAQAGPRVTEYSIPLGTVKSMTSLSGWISLHTREPTIVARTIPEIGEPRVERRDSFRLKFPDPSLASRVQRALGHAMRLCRSPGPRTEPF